MTNTQTANFVYWLTEYDNLRGLKTLHEPTPKDTFACIELLMEEFFRKYPKGILTGWTRVADKEDELPLCMEDLKNECDLNSLESNILQA